MNYQRIEPGEEFQDKQGIDCRVYSVTDKILAEEDKISEFVEEFRGCLSTHPQTRVVLDFQGVDFLSSMALGNMITSTERCKSLGRPVPSFIGLKPKVYEVFEITRLDRVLDATTESLTEYRQRPGASA